MLTNESFILDNNSFLTIQISMYIYIGILLVLLLMTAMILVYMIERRERKITELRKNIEIMYVEREELEKEISFMNSFHTRWSLFEENMLQSFIRKLHERNVCPVTMVELKFGDVTARNEFLDRAQLLLDERILRFSNGTCNLYLLFVQYNREEAAKALEHLPKVSGCEMITWQQGDKQEKTLQDVFGKFMEKTGEVRKES